MIVELAMTILKSAIIIVVGIKIFSALWQAM